MTDPAEDSAHVPKLSRLLARAYAELDDFRVEAVRAFDADGLERFGSETNAGSGDEITIEEHHLPQLKDAIVVHNHPSGWRYPPDHPMHAGKSFSQEDVFLAIEYDMRELQAVTPIWVYWLRRSDRGWPVAARTAQQRYVDLVNDLADEMLGLILDDRLTIEEGEPELFHRAMVALCQEYGVGYGRWRRRMETS